MSRLTDLTIHRRARALGNYWDGLVRRSTIAADPLPTDTPELTELIRYVHGVWDPDRDQSPTGDLVLDGLLTTHQEMKSVTTTTFPGSFPVPQRQAEMPWHFPQTIGAPFPVLPRSVGRWFPTLVTAMVLVITLGIVYELQLFRGGSGPSNLGGSAILAPATPSPEGATDEILAEISLPADTFAGARSNGGLLSISFSQMSVPPNTTASDDVADQAKWTGPTIVHVLDGTLSVTSDGPVQLVRGDGDTSAVDQPAATEIVLATGDTVVLRSEISAIWTTSDTAAELLYVVAVVGMGPGDPRPDGWETLDDAVFGELGAAPTGLSLVRVRQVGMEPEEVVSFGPDEMSAFLIDGGGPGFLGENSDGSITLKGATETTIVYIFTIEPAEASATPTP